VIVRVYLLYGVQTSGTCIHLALVSKMFSNRTRISILSASAIIGIAFGLSYLFLGRKPMGVPRLTLTGTESHYYCVAFSPDSKLIAAGQQDGTVKIWETDAGAERFTLPGQTVPVHNFGAAVFSIAFSTHGGILAWGGGDRKVNLLDVATKKIIGTLETAAIVRQVRFTADNKFLVTATDDGIVRFWDLDSKISRIVFEEKKSKHFEGGIPRLRTVALDPDDTTLAIGLFGKVVFLDLKKGTERVVLTDYQGLVHVVAFSPDGKHLAGIATTARIWDAATAEELMSLPNIPATAAGSLAFSPSGKMLAVGDSGLWGRPHHVQIFDLTDKRRLALFACHQGGLKQMTWSPDGKTLATCSQDNMVKLWDTGTILKN
jgi:WD40 repeat protein